MLDDNGQVLYESEIKRGLLELNRDFHFDAGGNLNLEHPFINQRQGVWHLGRHICSMDRGSISEFKRWTMEDAIVEVSFSEADREDVWVQFVVVASDVPNYCDLCLGAARGVLPEYSLRSDGLLVRLSCRSIRKVHGRVMFVGWRHTFERILHFGVPGVTRSSLAAKFKVDMLKCPIGTIEELQMALIAE